MSILFLIKVFTNMYFISLLVTPIEIYDMTAKFLSLIVYKADQNNLVSHLIQSCCLLISFIVLFSVTGINAIKTFAVPRSQVSSSPVIKQTSTQNNNNAPIITPMRSAADTATSHNNNNKQAEPITASVRTSTSSTSASASSANTTPCIVLESLSSPKDESPSITEQQPIQLINTDTTSTTITTAPTIIKKRDPTVPDVQVIPMKVEEYVKDQVAQPTILAQTPEPIIPQQQNNENDSSASTEVADDDNRSFANEQFYEGISKKGNDIMAFSKNLDRLFQDPPTPSPDHTLRPISVPHPSTILIDEAIATTPALTPPNQSSAAGSTLSRKSSTASQHSTVFKSRLQMAMQKVARSSTINNNNNNKQQDPVVITASSSTAAKKNRFSSIRLTRKKSINSVVDSSQPESSTSAAAAAAAAADHSPSTIKPKRSVSTKFLKKTGKRLSKIFT